MYDLVVMGEKIEAVGLENLQIDPDSLLECGGEIGNFQLLYKNGGEKEEVVSRTILINIPPARVKIAPEKVGTAGDFLSLDEELPFLESAGEQGSGLEESLIFIQDYQEISPSWMSNLGLKKAAAAAGRFPEGSIYYFYRSMRFTADNDELFERARVLGVVFLKYERGELEITASNEVSYNREEPLKLAGKIVIAPEFEPAESLERIGKILNLKPAATGYLQPENVYLQPAYSGKRGVYLLGGSRGKTAYSSLDEEIEYALNEIRALPEVIQPLTPERREVDDQKCILCYTCYRLCPHGAIERDEKLDAMKVLELACQGCDTCISHCPAAAISTAGSEEKKNGEGTLKVLLCENSAWTAWEKIPARERFQGLEVSSIPCAGSIKKEDIYQLLAEREERLLIIGCFAEACKHLTGDQKAGRVVKEVNRQLNELGLGEDRVRFERLSARMEEDLEGLLLEWQSTGRRETVDSSRTEKD